MSELPPVDLAAASPFVAAMKVEVTEASGFRVAGHVGLGPDQHTPWGVVHGGVYCSVVESAASIGARSAVLEHGQFAVGVNNNSKFLALDRWQRWLLTPRARKVCGPSLKAALETPSPDHREGGFRQAVGSPPERRNR
jgi:hypothetical protein